MHGRSKENLKSLSHFSCCSCNISSVKKKKKKKDGIFVFGNYLENNNTPSNSFLSFIGLLR